MPGQDAMAISDDLRAAIRASGKSLTLLAKESGVPQPMLTRFMNGQDLRLATVDKLCSYFGLTLRSADALKAKDKVKAPAPPAVDWTKAEPKKKPRDEGRERRK
jgi:transcriptional regulator with XRE-family HTH domain